MVSAEELAGLRPIGIFGQSIVGPVNREQYLPSVNGLHPELREKVARYLRSGAVVFAIMEYTNDVVGGGFSVPGGSGIASDGIYYWRQDTPNYVETYGLAIDAEAVELMEARDWLAPPLSAAQILDIDRRLFSLSNG